ncbi:DUF4843 domain-containing protein [Chitinophaga sp. SYP-B3965]|uniref:DUF4843 domain-containing protein n=1 Tax=Chitinophaga sp. SYP-B3965 TaxID=2663120 RepID=UPI0015670A00|nr:DUF4843 domain-containing protein [Chitinophaga sp. SYP-B3965]
MKKLFIFGLFGAVCLSACKKAIELTYQSPDNVYFDFTDPKDEKERPDSISYSFALFPDKSSDTILLPVRIAGMRKSVARKFKLTVIDSATTAVAGTHYKALEAEYTIPADSGAVKVPIIIYSTDAALTTKSVRMKFRLVASADFAVTTIGFDTAKVIFSNRLEQPTWWNTWAGELGAYSRVKHELFIRTAGTIDLPLTQNGEVIPKVLYHTRRFRSFLNDPIAWVAANPQEGYTVEAAGGGNYNFYSIANPAKKYLLELNPADNRYYFKDENGNRIV